MDSGPRRPRRRESSPTRVGHTTPMTSRRRRLTATWRSWRWHGALATVALVIVATTPIVAAADPRHETGPAECQPVNLRAAAILTVELSVGPCSFVNGLGLGQPNGLEIYLLGPSGYRKSIPISVAAEYTAAVPLSKLKVPRSGTYTLVVHWWRIRIPAASGTNVSDMTEPQRIRRRWPARRRQPLDRLCAQHPGRHPDQHPNRWRSRHRPRHRPRLRR